MDNNARWDPEVTRTLLNLCIEQINLGRRQGRCLTREAWDCIVVNFQRTTGRQYDRKKLKNKFDSLRGELRAWLAIKEESGLGWDHKTGTVTAPKSWWKQAGKNKYYPRFKDEGLQFEDELAFIFKDVLDDAGSELSPGILHRFTSEVVYRPSMKEDVPPEADMQEGSSDSEDDQFGKKDAGSTGLTNEMGGQRLSTSSGRSSQGKRKRWDGSSSSKKKKTATETPELISTMSRIAETSEKREKKYEALEKYSLPAVIDLVNELPECLVDSLFHIGCVDLLQKPRLELHLSICLGRDLWKY